MKKLEYIQFTFNFNSNDLTHLTEIATQIRNGFDILHITPIVDNTSGYEVNTTIIFSKRIQPI